MGQGGQAVKSEIIRECPNPKCGACGIKEFNNRPGYNMDIGEIVPQECPNCGTSLGQKYWGNIDRIDKEAKP
jgi:ribosomal protein S27AE